jgi:hypothetical protein
MKKSILGLLLFVLSWHMTTAQTPAEVEYNKVYQERIQLSRIDGVYIPKDLEDAFKELDNLSDAEAVLKFKSAPEDLVASKLQGGLGRWMVINWGFFEGSRLSHHLKSLGVHHPDDMALLLLVSYHRHLNERPLKIEEQAIEFQQIRAKENEERKKRSRVKIE